MMTLNGSPTCYVSTARGGGGGRKSKGPVGHVRKRGERASPKFVHGEGLGKFSLVP